MRRHNRSACCLSGLLILAFCLKPRGSSAEWPELKSSDLVRITPEKSEESDPPREIYQNISLFPLGFSPKGHFAYLKEEINGGCGYCPALIIFDLVHDRPIESIRFNEAQDDASGQPALTINSPEAKNLLNKYGVQPLSDKNLKRFPLITSGKIFSVKISRTPAAKGKYCDTAEIYKSLDHKLGTPNGKGFYDREDVKKSLEKEKGAFGLEIETVSIRLTSNLIGNKEIARMTQCEEGLSRLETVDGYILSPFEPRIAIFATEKFKGFENERGREFMIIGAHLNAGFRD